MSQIRIQHRDVTRPPSGQFPTDCTLCHLAADAAWQRGRFDHDKTDFPLQGAHTNLACDGCHRNGVYSGLPSSCYSCHKADYDATTNPNHKKSGFSTDCLVCHRATDARWQQATFDHSNTDFPLQGAHTKLACARCHTGGVYTGLSGDCYSCHKPDYDATTQPNHKASGFPTACLVCHLATDTSWTQGRFDHNNTGFPLQGAHTKLDCARCHAGGVYTGLSGDCYSCHKSNYDATTNPNHKASGFPTDCVACHYRTDTSWSQGRFTHNFPLKGKHDVPCTVCHTTPSNYNLFDCLGCHTLATTQEKHKEVGGFQYTSQACYACHPYGKGDD